MINHHHHHHHHITHTPIAKTHHQESRNPLTIKSPPFPTDFRDLWPTLTWKSHNPRHTWETHELEEWAGLERSMERRRRGVACGGLWQWFGHGGCLVMVLPSTMGFGFEEGESKTEMRKERVENENERQKRKEIENRCD